MKKLYKQANYRNYNNYKVRKQKKKELWNAVRLKNRKMHPKNDDEDDVIYTIIRFPSKLYLRDEILFEKINEAALCSAVNFNFSQVKNISVGSALYIKAYVDSHKTKQLIKISCSPENLKMREILQHMELKSYKIKITHKDIKCWIFKQWNKNCVENYGKVMNEEVLPKVLANRGYSERFADIASNLHELLYNCSEHAYEVDDLFTGYYFIAGEYESDKGKSNKFTFSVIDMGQGFRASLRKNSLFSEIKEKLNIESDTDLLKAAVDGKFNANPDKNSGRGTGLPAVKQTVQSINGILNISSGIGYYSYDGKEYLRERKNATIGSIITVNLPIN